MADVAVCLLTCDRADYTGRTLETFYRHNPDHRCFTLLYADDSSVDITNQELAKLYGFRCAVAPAHYRRGVARMTDLLVNAASRAGAKYVLMLQNDWECLRPLPMDDIQIALADPAVYCVRLYGKEKSPGRAAGTDHGGRFPRAEVEWAPMPGTEMECGDIHWGHPPSITRINEAIMLTQGATSEAISRQRSGHIAKLTARPIETIMSHIGDARTPDFRS